MSDEGANGCSDWCNDVESDTCQEKDEILVIAMTEAVIYIDTVMVEFLHALSADHAVESFSWLDDFAVEAEVLEVDVPIIPNLKQIEHV
jgi:hypothetical protein